MNTRSLLIALLTTCCSIGILPTIHASECFGRNELVTTVENPADAAALAGQSGRTAYVRNYSVTRTSAYNPAEWTIARQGESYTVWLAPPNKCASH